MTNTRNKPSQKALRQGRISEENARYFVTICSYKRAPILTEGDVTEILFTGLLKQPDDFDLVASVVMADHIHFVIKIGDSPLGSAIKRFKGRSAVEVNRHLGTSGAVWQKGYYDHKFRGDDDLAPILNYMWKNPDHPGKHFRCNRKDWLWFKSIVTQDLEYPAWLREHPLG